MIEKINQIQKWVETISTATIGVVSGYFISEIVKESQFQFILLFALIMIIILFEKLIDAIVRFIITNSNVLRKLVSGNHYIEGYWLEKIVHIDNPTEPYGYALIKISFSNMQYSVSGEVTNKELTDCIANFQSTYSDYKNFNLTYYFKGINVTDNLTMEIIGKGEFDFIEGEKIPTRLRGSIIDTKNHNMLKMEAEKVNNEIIKKYAHVSEKQVIEIIRLHLLAEEITV